jgi:tryptophan synthase beta chain
MSEATKFLLTEDRIPTHWVNLLPDLPGEPLPPLNPQTVSPPARRTSPRSSRWR